MENGYFLLSRNIFESAIWRDDPHILKLFIYLIGKARHSTNPKKYPRVLVKQGELVTSLAQISEDNEYIWNKGIRSWSRAKVSRMLETLEKQKYITIISDSYGTHISICNYETYQNPKRYKTDSFETTMKQPCNNHETTPSINNNVNNVKNDNNVEDKESKPKKKNTTYEKPKSVNSQIWEDFKTLRRTKKAPITKTAMDSIEKEIKKAGISFNDGLQAMIIYGWQGFKAEWYFNKTKKVMNDDNKMSSAGQSTYNNIQNAFDSLEDEENE